MEEERTDTVVVYIAVPDDGGDHYNNLLIANTAIFSEMADRKAYPVRGARLKEFSPSEEELAPYREKWQSNVRVEGFSLECVVND